jgi:Endonuclease/Exonuclease/phosphatase family
MPLVVLYNVQRLLRPGGSAVARALDATEDRGWDAEAYRRKVDAVGSVLASATGGTTPAILVLIEVEDASVVGDVSAAAGWPQLVNVDVPNEQVDGYDVAIAYDPAIFTGQSTARSFTFENRFATRDLLTASLQLPNGGSLLVAATHWASRTMARPRCCASERRYSVARYLSRRSSTARKNSSSPQAVRACLPGTSWQRSGGTPILIAGDFNDSRRLRRDDRSGEARRLGRLFRSTRALIYGSLITCRFWPRLIWAHRERPPMRMGLPVVTPSPALSLPPESARVRSSRDATAFAKRHNTRTIGCN